MVKAPVEVLACRLRLAPEKVGERHPSQAAAPRLKELAPVRRSPCWLLRHNS